jgi:GNAT superfamily N-acetyltransferase
VLSVLTIVTDPGEAAWVAQFEALRAAPKTYYTVVIVDKNSDQIVAVGTVFLERKFIRGLGCAGHIEDIAVDKRQQGKKLGLRIIQALVHISESSGCYKTILDCSDDNVRECCFSFRLFVWASVQLPYLQRSTLNAGSRRKKTRWCACLWSSDCQADIWSPRSNTPLLGLDPHDSNRMIQRKFVKLSLARLEHLFSTSNLRGDSP